VNAIIQTGAKEYKLTARGNEFTLRFDDIFGQWAMYTVNAAVRAWNRGFAIPKFFDTLEDVERAYKSWKGIVALVAQPCNPATASDTPSLTA
jgi:hypothetical protein